MNFDDSSKNLVDKTNKNCLHCDFFNSDDELSLAFDYIMVFHTTSELSEKICDILNYITRENGIISTPVLKDELISRELLYDEDFYKRNLVRLYRYLYKQISNTLIK